MNTIEEFQNKAILMLNDFDAFCTANNLRYFVIGGACIGAARHKGPIPWDDDIDVFMPRPDYEKMHQIWKDNALSSQYTLCRSNDKVNYRNLVTLMKDNNTTFINKHSINLDIHHGYMLDIIPIDGAAPTKLKRFFQITNAMVYSVFNAQRLPDNQGGMIRSLTKAIYFVFKSDKLKYKIWSRCEKQMTKYPYDEAEYITELATGVHYIKNLYPKAIFENYTELPFKDGVVKVPAGYDQYLTMAFGNYMEMPKAEQQEPKHDVVFSDLNNSYLKYKGIEYLKDGK